jgi:cation transport regulator
VYALPGTHAGEFGWQPVAIAVRRWATSEVHMPYRENIDLPLALRRHLPEHAQDIYRAAFNQAFSARAGDSRQEEAAHRIAWAAVKRSFVKVGDEWVARSQLE